MSTTTAPTPSLPGMTDEILAWAAGVAATLRPMSDENAAAVGRMARVIDARRAAAAKAA